MSYSLQKLEAEVVVFKNKIDRLEDENYDLEESLNSNKISIANYQSNVFDLEQTFSKLKGETK
jgi:hypothetical protein